MARALKTEEEAEAELPPLREPLRDALERVEEAKSALAENATAQDHARAKVREAEKAIEEAEKELAAAPALQRRALRAALQSAQDDLTDWTDHLSELRKKVSEGFGSLANQLDRAQQAVKDERDKLLLGHPVVSEKLERLEWLRREAAQTMADLHAIPPGAIPPEHKNWQASNHIALPPADPALVAWLENLLVDPRAELSE